MKRNTIFGAAALLVAGAAIGAGSVVSQNAMADTGTPAPANELTMVNIGADGTAIQCTFSGADVEGLLPQLPAGAPVEVAPSGGNVVVGVAQITPADGPLPELPMPADGQPPVAVSGVSGVVSVEAGTGEMTVNGQPAETREGTAEECAAMRTQAVEIAKSVPAGATITGTNGSISGGASVAEGTKP